MPFYHAPLSIALSLLHVFVWWRLVKPAMAPGTPRRVVTGLLVALDLFMVAALWLGTRTPPAVAGWFAWPGWIWFGAFFYLALATLVVEIPRLALRPWVRRDPGAGGVSRRAFLARGAAAVAGVTAAAAVGVGMPSALGDPRVVTVRIRLPRLDTRADGLRIALVSDLHLGALLGRSFTRRVVDLVNAQRPDLVAIAGDLVEGTLDHLADAAEPLRDLRSRHGTFFVTGNHEYHYRYTEWVDHVRTLGVRPLLNERTTIVHNGGEVELAGVLDPGAELEDEPGPDVAKALRGWDRSRALVLLAHQPAVLEDAAAAGVDLQLSGHTHGGQIAPFTLLVKALEGTTAGLSRLGDTQLYVTRGAGFYGPPLRVGAPPDIAVVTLLSS
ncbi:MAG: metallophosphoesterase [Actinophytocola sp.]|uniref:metallophosphoesterase n=1 Tax=Actinophytocola sp. TaxID=1872138 RepID=UPI001324C703|nr:metallophosphoesterase [Actinophytocola sp.]MPZ86412.1 metallophosphoesterase [Actinophytocola sp.]